MSFSKKINFSIIAVKFKLINSEKRIEDRNNFLSPEIWVGLNTIDVELPLYRGAGAGLAGHC